jgi:hypothetical protein
MIATIENIEVDLSKPIDISIPITNTMPTQLLGILKTGNRTSNI